MSQPEQGVGYNDFESNNTNDVLTARERRRLALEEVKKIDHHLLLLFSSSKEEKGQNHLHHLVTN